LVGGITNGYRYIFTVLDPPLANREISIMELSSAPVFIQQASGTFGTIQSNQAISMSMSFFTNPPPEQKAYFRVSTNGFASWLIIQAPITGTSASATFPLSVSSAVTTRWYAFTSTATSNYLSTASGNAIDALSISWDNRQGTNYLVKVNPQQVDFIYHNNNRVIFGSNVQFFAKAGYANSDGSDRWANEGAIYYTTDNSTPSGAYGVPSGTTKVAPMNFSHMEGDSFALGDAMWFAGTATNLPGFTAIKYKIGLWYNTSSPERFADYVAGTNNQTFTFQLGQLGDPVLTVNGKSADYTTSKFWIDEIAGDTRQVVVYYTPGVASPDKVEIFSNLDRRDYTDVDFNTDGIPDGIKPPSGNIISTNDFGSYYRAYAMTSIGSGQYVWTGLVSKTGAYRLTARYQTNGVWRYYSELPRRDHAIVVSPKKVLDQTMYELNTLTVEAQGADQNGRSTFVDLLSAAEGDSDGYDPFNLDYLNSIQANCLWFQPIHPTAGARQEYDSSTGAPYAPGSPYATKNYFAVGPQFGEFYNEDSAMNEFTNFVNRCDNYAGSVGTINVMLDGVFNHTAWDAIFGQGAVDLGFKQTIGDSGSGNISANAPIGQNRKFWYAKNGDYCATATSWTDANNNDFATAPDRGDFGKWNDVAELYFGRYASLVCQNPQDNGNYLNEQDWFDFAGMGPGVVEIWKYFAYYAEYWIKKTGHSGTNSFVQALDDRGIDGLRCDFGQGLPPQMWEYVINHTRKIKWNFMFMAETLDGGNPGYRSNRHFDILNESFVFQFTQAKVNNSYEIYSALEQRRNAYNSGTILLNLTSHDEILPDDDPWVTVSRYGAVGSVDGIPMIMYGQEHGIKNFQSNPAFGWDDGFVYHELNFGKYIPHFKKWNQLTVWFNSPPNSTGILQLYSRINWARHQSPALRSQNRYFLSRTSGGDNADIFAVAKYETAGVGPAGGDVVLAFANLLDHSPSAHTAASDVYSLQGPWGLLGLNTGKTYSARNLSSSTPNAILPGWPKTGQDLWNNGVYVALNADNGQSITNDGALVQYLKIEEVAVNNAPVINLPGPHTLAVGSFTSFVVTVSDADNNPVTTNMVTSPSGATFVGGVFSWTAGVASENTTNALVFVANDQQGQPNSVVTGATVIIVPFDFDSDGLGDGWEYGNFSTLTNSALDDNDGDGSSNFDEYNAGTSPTNIQSAFKVTTVVNALGSTNRLVSVATSPGKKYTIYYSDESFANNMTWLPFANNGNGIGTWTETNITPTTYTFVDDEGPATTGGAPSGTVRNYRFVVGTP
jgi:hypothetical protein